tara:strand:- start:114 stop:1100 length:987 start_codon:yes stop_codon:yes gene_type:complete
MGKSHDIATMASDGFAFPSAVTITKPSNAELVTNGDFSNGTTGWTASGATLSVSGGQLTVADNGGYTKAYQGVTTVVNQTYTLSVTQVSVTGQNSVIGLSSAVPTGNTWGNMVSFAKASGDLPHTQTHTFKATGTTTYISIGSEGTNSAVFDNVSLKEVGLPDNQILTAGDLTTEFNNLGIGVTASGSVTKPYQPMVRLRLSSHFAANTSHSDPGVQIAGVFTVRENIGNHWNSSNNNFTCPVAGVYSVSVFYIKYPSSGKWTGVDLHKNGSAVDGIRWRAPEINGGYHQAGGTIAITCAANDVLDWHYVGTAGIHSNNGAWQIMLLH